MTSVPGVDRPEEQTQADLTLLGRGISVSTLVESVSGGVIAVRPSVGEYAEQMVAKVGDRMEVFWRGPEHHRSLPAEVIDVEQGAVVRWRLQITGPAEQSQRRKAVRARVSLPVFARTGSIDLKGETADLSEDGMRAMLDGWGLPPEPGMALDVRLELEDGPVTSKAQVVRQQSRGARWLTSIKFVGLAEKDQDRLRRRVFQALREDRARGVQ
jgi:hypothetical protein